jgi:hypothetical protein
MESCRARAIFRSSGAWLMEDAWPLASGWLWPTGDFLAGTVRCAGCARVPQIVSPTRTARQGSTQRHAIDECFTALEGAGIPQRGFGNRAKCFPSQKALVRSDQHIREDHQAGELIVLQRSVG